MQGLNNLAETHISLYLRGANYEQSPLSPILNFLKENLIDMKREHAELKESPLILEYLALSYYYTQEVEKAILSHNKAKELDVDKSFDFVWNNDLFFQKLESDGN